MDIDLAGIDPAADIAPPGTATLDRDFAPAPRLERLPAEQGESTEDFGSRGTPSGQVYSSAHTSKGEGQTPLSRDGLIVGNQRQLMQIHFPDHTLLMTFEDRQPDGTFALAIERRTIAIDPGR